MALTMISLIDDDESVREATTSLLRSIGYTVHAFESARAFLSSIILDETRCAIIDLMMPDIDGFELHRRLVKGGHRFPVIYLTAMTGEAATDRMQRSGAFCVLAKPCPERRLLDCVEAALNGRHYP